MRIRDSVGINCERRNRDIMWQKERIGGKENGGMEGDRHILGGSKITADGDCCHKIKRRLLRGRKTMTNLDSMLKSIDIILPTKVYLGK